MRLDTPHDMPLPLGELRTAEHHAPALLPVGEHRLMVAVLLDAIEAFQKHIFATRRKYQTLFRETEAWLLSQDRSSPFAFESICEALDLDPERLRTGIGVGRNRQPVRASLPGSQDRRVEGSLRGSG